MAFDLVARLRLHDDFSSRLSGVTRQIDRAATGVNNFTKQVGSIASAIGITAAVAGGFNAVRNSIDSAVSRYDTLNNFPRVMEQVGFSTDESSAAIDRLSDGIMGLPTKLDEVTGTAQRIAVMTKDLDGAVDTTLALNNAFIASGSDANNAARGLEQYVQMLSKGEVDLQSWRTLQETMGLALNDVAEAFGFAGESAQNDLYEALKEGHITFDEFNAKLIELSDAPGGFAERALTASGGIRTAWTNMQTSISRGVANVIAAIDEALGGTGSIEGIIFRIRTGIDSAFKAIVNAIPVIADWLSTVKDTLEPWQPLIERIAKSFSLAVGAIAGITGFISVFKAVAGVLGFMISPVGLIALAIMGIATAFQNAYEKSEAFRTKIDNLKVFFERFLTGGNVSADMLLKILGLSPEQIETIKGFINNVIEIATNLKDQFIEIVTTLYNAAKPIFDNIGGIFSMLADIATIAFNNVIVPAVTFMWTAFQTAWNIIGPILQLLGAAIGTAFSVLKFVWDTILKPVATFLTGQFAYALNSVKPILDVIGNAFGWLGDKINGVVSWLKSVADWFNRIKVPDWVSKIGGAVGNFFGGIGKTQTAKSHYHGIDYVPRDGYQAVLHKGERVLTAEENKTYNQGRSVTIAKLADQIVVREEADIDKIAYKLARVLEQEEVRMG